MQVKWPLWVVPTVLTLRADAPVLTRSNLPPPCADKFHGLPLAHTCFFHIELPEYKSYEDLRRSLITAITWGAGEGFLIV